MSSYRSYFSSAKGIGYTLLRIPIGGSDFDLDPWAYNEYPENDLYLTNFTTLDHRDLLIVDHIKSIESILSGKKLKLMGCAWSPPKWMKTNNEWTGFGILKDEYYRTWAQYHLRFLEVMQRNNVSFWAISTGNEPMNGIIWWDWVVFMSLGWLPDLQVKLINVSNFFGFLIF